MRVLVACEESQTVATAFREVGHEAYSCDLAECSGGHPYTKRTCLWLKNLPPLPLPILFGKELPRMLMEVVKTLMGITEDFRVGMSVTQKLVQKHFRVLHKQWPDSGEAI